MNEIGKPTSVGGQAFALQGDASTVRRRSRHLTRQMIADMLGLYDYFAIFSSGLLSYYIYVSSFGKTSTPLLDYVSVIAIVAFLFHFLARKWGLYAFDKMENLSSQLSMLISICMATFAALFVLLFFMKISQRFSRIWFAQWSFLFLFLLAIGRGLFAHLIERIARKGGLRRSVAIIGAGSPYSAVQEFLLGDERHFRISGALDTLEWDCRSSEIEEALTSFVNEARDAEVDEVIVALPGTQTAYLDEVVRRLQSLPADIHIVPDFGNARFPVMKLSHDRNFAFITTSSKPIREWSALIKRIEDFTLAAVALLLAAPAMLLIAIAIKFDSKGPVFFRQRRHGYNHRVIEVLKFRSMTVLEDGEKVEQAKKNDPRITRFGRILRRTSLDELPQLINVLRGDMSIVGPRPHALAHNSYYGDLVENYANRHRVKPGITGWAQVHGFRGETEDTGKMAMRVRYDLEYIDNWSIWLDLKIVLMTPFFGLLRRTAY